MPDKVRVVTGQRRIDLLAQHYEQPILRSSSHNGSYLGRIILELYDIRHPKEERTDVDNLPYTVGPASGLTASELVQRVAAAFLLSVASTKYSNALTGPLAGHNQPIIGEDSPNDRYLGRIVVEMYTISGLQEQQKGMDNLICLVDPASVLTASELTQRVATAFSLRAKNQRS